MAVMIILCALFMLIVLYAACMAASDADDWSERMRDEIGRRQIENQSGANGDHPGSGTGADVRRTEIQRPGELEDR